MIDSKELILTTLTPLCSHGADPELAEFRVTEVKNLMRFWWRALNHFETVDEMWKEEAKLFGSTKCKSPLQIRKRFEEQINQTQKNINNANNRGQNQYGDNVKWLTGSGFYIYKFGINFAVFKYDNKETALPIELNNSMDYYINLLKVAAILGGMGNRSRRGAGVVKVEVNGERQTGSLMDDSAIFTKLKSLFEKLKIDGYYQFDNSKKEITRIKKVPEDLEYPYLEKIIIGRNKLTKGNLASRVKKAMEAVKGMEYKDPDVERLACPVYLSAYGEIDRLYPVVSHLYNPNPSRQYESYKTTLTNEVIG